MDWGSRITSLGTTTLKERAVTFGIKDTDRLKHLCVLGRAAPIRAKFLSNMIFQDIERGLGTIVLDAHGNVAPYILERLGAHMSERVIYLDPAEAEYPYTWNPLADVRMLPQKTREKKMVELVTSVYQLSSDVLVNFALPMLLEKKETTLVTFYDLVCDEKKRQSLFGGDDEGRASFESALAQYPDLATEVESVGRYITKDTLIRNLLGQRESKFSVSDLAKGKIVMVNLEKVRVFPTRMTPLVRTFIEGALTAGEVSLEPIAVYVHDTLRYLGTREIDRTFRAHRVAMSVSDTALEESDLVCREQALCRCGSIVSFASDPLDKPLTERAFYPYIAPNEIEALEAQEFVSALTVDDVRTQPFFGTAFSQEKPISSSYQDLIAHSRKTYTTPRATVDALFKSDDDENRRPKKPGAFQDAFKAMFDKRAKAFEPPAPQSETKQESKAEASQEETSKEAPAQKKNTLENVREIPELALKEMIYVPAV